MVNEIEYGDLLEGLAGVWGAVLIGLLASTTARSLVPPKSEPGLFVGKIITECLYQRLHEHRR